MRVIKTDFSGHVGGVVRGQTRFKEREGEPFAHLTFEMPVVPQLTIQRLHDNIVMPKYASEGDSGMDVCATQSILIRPGETVQMPLGFKMGIPRHPFHAVGYRWEVQVRPRSGVSKKTMLRVSNAPGTIDNFYTSEVGILLTNTAAPKYGIEMDGSITLEEQRHSGAIMLDGEEIGISYASLRGHGEELYNQLVQTHGYGYDMTAEGTILIRKGERIAQLVLNEVIRPLDIVEGKVDESVSRGGGFGSTGL